MPSVQELPGRAGGGATSIDTHAPEVGGSLIRSARDAPVDETESPLQAATVAPRPKQAA